MFEYPAFGFLHFMKQNVRKLGIFCYTSYTFLKKKCFAAVKLKFLNIFTRSKCKQKTFCLISFITFGKANLGKI